MNELVLDDNKDIVFGNFKLHRNGLQVVGQPTFEQWEECGEFIRKCEGAVHYWIGDWLNYGENKWGEMYSQAMGETGYDYGTLRNDKYVSGKVDLSLRSDNLSPTHAKEIASLPQEEKKFWAEEIKKEAMPVRELREKIRQRKKDSFPKNELPGGKFNTIVIDPPWPMEFMKLEMRPNQVEMPYPTMTIDEIKALPIKDKASEDCNLFLWTTHKFLPDCFEILKAWGFEYHVCLTWDKTNGRSLFGFNRRTELCLYAHNGKITVNQRGKFIDTVFVEKLRQHSRKPTIFDDILRSNSPAPRLEWFSRESKEGFVSYGNEEGKLNGIR